MRRESAKAPVTHPWSVCVTFTRTWLCPAPGSSTIRLYPTDCLDSTSCHPPSPSPARPPADCTSTVKARTSCAPAKHPRRGRPGLRSVQTGPANENGRSMLPVSTDAFRQRLRPQNPKTTVLAGCASTAKEKGAHRDRPSGGRLVHVGVVSFATGDLP